MNKTLVFLFISLTILTFSVITLSSAPIINKNLDYIDWASGNCKYISDKEEASNSLNDKYIYSKEKTLCERKKAAYSLEYASFISNIIFGFLCLFLSFLQYFKIGKDFLKNTGLVGLIAGCIGFILTFIYFVYSAYIFVNDNNEEQKKLFPNGAYYKWDGNKYITAFEGDEKHGAEYAKYNELGQKQYNYDTDYNYIYYDGEEVENCHKDRINPNNKRERIKTSDRSKDCDYLFDKPKEDFKNKYLYDKWTTTLIFAFFISLCDLALSLFGFLLFKQSDNSSDK